MRWSWECRIPRERQHTCLIRPLHQPTLFWSDQRELRRGGCPVDGTARGRISCWKDVQADSNSKSFLKKRKTTTNTFKILFIAKGINLQICTHAKKKRQTWAVLYYCLSKNLLAKRCPSSPSHEQAMLCLVMQATWGEWKLCYITRHHSSSDATIPWKIAFKYQQQTIFPWTWSSYICSLKSTW